MKNDLLYIAMGFMILSIIIKGNENEVRWFWVDLPWVPFTFILLSLLCIGVFLLRERKIKKTKIE